MHISDKPMPIRLPDIVHAIYPQIIHTEACPAKMAGFLAGTWNGRSSLSRASVYKHICGPLATLCRENCREPWFTNLSAGHSRHFVANTVAIRVFSILRPRNRDILSRKMSRFQRSRSGPPHERTTSYLAVRPAPIGRTNPSATNCLK